MSLANAAFNTSPEIEASLRAKFIVSHRHFVTPERPQGESGTHELRPAKVVFMGSGLTLCSSRNDEEVSQLQGTKLLESLASSLHQRCHMHAAFTMNECFA